MVEGWDWTGVADNMVSIFDIAGGISQPLDYMSRRPMD